QLAIYSRSLHDALPIFRLGGGFRDLEVRILETLGGTMLVTHLIVDTRDAMGANAVNTMAEKVAPQIAAWSGGRVYLRILSNLARSEEHTSELQSRENLV